MAALAGDNALNTWKMILEKSGLPGCPGLPERMVLVLRDSEDRRLRDQVRRQEVSGVPGRNLDLHVAGSMKGKSGTKVVWLRGVDLNHRPLGYEPNELPDCSTPQLYVIAGPPTRQTRIAQICNLR